MAGKHCMPLDHSGQQAWGCGGIMLHCSLFWLQFYTERLKELRRRILEERDAAMGKTVPSAFVTFKCAPGSLCATCCCSGPPLPHVRPRVRVLRGERVLRHMLEPAEPARPKAAMLHSTL